MFLKRIGVIVASLLVVGLSAGPAAAYTFTRPLQAGDKGPDVTALQVRVAGWFPQDGQTAMGVDGTYGPGTAAAVKAFQEFYGLDPDGIAGPTTFAVLEGIEDDDGSTANFEWSEFWQKSSPNCSAKANSYAGTFKGGMATPQRVKKNIKRIMWRLEAMRAKSGGKTIAITSGFRSVPYNACIGGASASQHMYGTAADSRMAEVTNRYARDLARRSQFYGIGCYSSMSFNHMDLRIENKDYPDARYWWWPDQDSKGRDLADDGKPCYGEGTEPVSERTAAKFLPSDQLVRSLSTAPEWYGGFGD